MISGNISLNSTDLLFLEEKEEEVPPGISDEIEQVHEGPS